jgi:hypothetical protein
VCCSPNAVYVVNTEDLQVESLGGGAIRKYVVTPKKFWGLAMGSTVFVAGLRISELDPNAGVTVKYQWSLDGAVWQTGSTVVTEKTSPGDYTGEHTTTSEKTPFGRLLVEVRDTTSSNQLTGQISVFEYVRYN